MQKTYIIDDDSRMLSEHDFALDWMAVVRQELKLQDPESEDLDSKIGVIFVSTKRIEDLNKAFRGKEGPTDVLSFEGVEESVLGELVLCGDVLKEQASQHDMTLRQELGYMLIHGFLHLLGYEHETNEEDAQEMFALQDDLFERLCEKFFPDNP